MLCAEHTHAVFFAEFRATASYLTHAVVNLFKPCDCRPSLCLFALTRAVASGDPAEPKGIVQNFLPSNSHTLGLLLPKGLGRTNLFLVDRTSALLQDYADEPDTACEVKR